MSDILSGGGLLIAAAAAAAAIVLPPGRRRSAAAILALALCPVLIAGEEWHSAEISDLRDEPMLITAALALGALAVGALALAFRRWPTLLPLAIIAALPFRVPIEAGGDTANLLVPLYLVIAAGVLAAMLRPASPVVALGPSSSPAAAGGSNPRPPAPEAARWMAVAAACFLLLYSVQVLYSADFSKGLQNVGFFLVPFALVFVLIRDAAWDGRLLRLALIVVAVEAVAFVVVGSVEYLSGSLFWNDHVIRSNEFHTYFRVNSAFWDPNIYGRYLALAITLAMAVLLWARERRTLAALTGLVAVLWIGLVPTFSQSSFAALLGGLATLAAVRWSLGWTLVTTALAAVLGVLVILFAGGNPTINPSRINIDTSGRANLVTGGVELFAKRPLWGFGSGGFPTAYRERVATAKAPVSVSHTQPVTVAAEQGLIGLAAYAALLGAALWTMAARLPWARRAGPGWVGSGDAAARTIGRVAVLAAFVALLVHTMAYAGFVEDPITWTLLGVGAALATASASPPPRLCGD